MPDALHNGAAAFGDLLAYVGDLSNMTCSDLHEHGDAADTRDYVGMSEMVAQSLAANLGHADLAHRQGYLRALTSLLCIVADQCVPSSEWEPVRETAPAFDAVANAAALIGRAAQ